MKQIIMKGRNKAEAESEIIFFFAPPNTPPLQQNGMTRDD
jgi:hypothetical protein